MANIIALFKKYIPLLDEVYKLGAKSSVIDSNASLAKQGANTNELIIPKLSMSGLGKYDRNAGYVKGDVTLNNETVKFNYERGRIFQVDAMDDEETAFLAFGQLASEFIRTKVVPEIDAFRFAIYASTTGISKATPSTLTDGSAVLAALITAKTKMDEDEVPEEGRILFITPTLANTVMALDTTKSREVLAAFSSIVKVPQSRFYTAITLNDGTTPGQEAGGFVKDSTNGKDINFLIVHPTAVLQFPKHVVPKVVTPAQNQEADAWKFAYRNYGLADVYENKVAGIYLHNKA